MRCVLAAKMLVLSSNVSHTGLAHYNGFSRFEANFALVKIIEPSEYEKF
jgi:hypothetical protein